MIRTFFINATDAEHRKEDTSDVFARAKDSSPKEPSTVTSIGQNGSNGCTGLTSAVMGNSVTNIEDGAFYGCRNLASVNLGNALIAIARYAFVEYAFGECAALTNITVSKSNPVFSSLDGVLFNKTQDTLLLFPQGKRGEYVVPDSVLTISCSATFREKTNLQLPRYLAAQIPLYKLKKTYACTTRGDKVGAMDLFRKP